MQLEETGNNRKKTGRNRQQKEKENTMVLGRSTTVLTIV